MCFMMFDDVWRCFGNICLRWQEDAEVKAIGGKMAARLSSSRHISAISCAFLVGFGTLFGPCSFEAPFIAKFVSILERKAGDTGQWRFLGCRLETS